MNKTKDVLVNDTYLDIYRMLPSDDFKEFMLCVLTYEDGDDINEKIKNEINRALFKQYLFNIGNREVWRDVKGYEGRYMVSNKGRIKSIGYGKTKILKCSPNNNGYPTVTFCVNSETCVKNVHRIVAETFLPNPENKPEVEHIDTNKLNNVVWINDDGTVNYEKTNLRWVTHIENMNNELTKQKISDSFNHNTRPIPERPKVRIVQMTLSGEEIAVYASQTEAMLITGVNQTNISACCRGKLKQAGGFKWHKSTI